MLRITARDRSRRCARASALTAAVCALALLAGRLPEACAAEPVAVLYAGSLVNLMERGIGPGFDASGEGTFQGYAAGSNALASQIKGQLRRGDVLISANPKVDESLRGAANGSWVSWYITFASSPLVVGYSPTSRFRAAFKSKPWYEALSGSGVRLGRTDPRLDPKGALTLELVSRAEEAYHSPGLSQRLLGAPDNPTQVLPEETLVGRLQSGQLDAGFFYSTEATDAGIPVISLPPDITPKALYTVTILRDSPNPTGAVRFVTYLLGTQGQRVLQQHGLSPQRLALAGSMEEVPPEIRSLLDKAK